MKETAEALCIW